MHFIENNREKCVGEVASSFGMHEKCLCVFVLILLTTLNTVTYTSQLMSFLTPDHWCRDANVAALQEQLPLTLDDSKKFSVPPLQRTDASKDETVQFSQCTRYAGDLVEAYIAWTAAHRPSHYSPPTLVTLACDQGWAYNHSGFSPTITTQNDWVCNDSWKPFAVQSAFWVNAAFGSFVTAALNHRCGRRLVLTAALAINVIGGGVATLCPTGFLGLLASRSLLGVGFIVISVLPLLVAVEANGEGRHAMVLTTVALTNTVVMWVTTWAALLINDWWRLELLRTILSFFCLLLSCRWLPESPRWWTSTGQNIKTITMLRETGKWSGLRFPPDLVQGMLEDAYKPDPHTDDMISIHHNSEDSEDEKPLGVKEEPSILYPRICTSTNVVWIICSFGYFAVQHYSPQFLADATGARLTAPDAFASMWYAAVIEVPCWTLPLLLQGRRRRRRTTLLVALTVVAMLCGVYTQLPPEYSEIKICCGLLAKMLLTAAFYAALQHRVTLYTDANRSGRFQEFNISSGLGGLAIATTPIVIYLGEVNSSVPMLIIGVCILIAPMIACRNYFKKLPRSTSESITNTSAQLDSRITSTIPYKKYEFT